MHCKEDGASAFKRQVDSVSLSGDLTTRIDLSSAEESDVE